MNVTVILLFQVTKEGDTLVPQSYWHPLVCTQVELKYIHTSVHKLTHTLWFLPGVCFTHSASSPGFAEWCCVYRAAMPHCCMLSVGLMWLAVVTPVESIWPPHDESHAPTLSREQHKPKHTLGWPTSSTHPKKLSSVSILLLRLILISATAAGRSKKFTKELKAGGGGGGAVERGTRRRGGHAENTALCCHGLSASLALICALGQVPLMSHR